MATSEDDIFSKAVTEYEAEKQEQEENRNFNYEDLERPEWVGMELEKPLVIRIVGMPISVRNQNWHPKSLYQSEILSDNGKSLIKVNWHQILDSNDRETGQLDPDWLLNRIFEDITEKEWEDNPDGEINPKNGKVRKRPVFYHHDNPVFKRVMEKNMRPNDKFPRRFDPYIRAILPVIDRNDNWCKKNKHTKLLTSSKNYWKDDKQGNPIYFTDTGVPFADVYEFILLTLAKQLDNWKDWDVVITRRKTLQGKSIRYKYHITHGGDAVIPSEAKKIVVTDGLTEEELNYEHYNLDKIFSPCSYQKIQKHLIKLFKEWDAYAGSTYTEELNELVKIEKEEFAAKKVEEEKTQHHVKFPENINEKDKDNDDENDDLPPAAVEEKQLRRKRYSISENISIREQCSLKFPKWNDIPDVDSKAILESIEFFDDDIPVWKDNITLFPCENRNCKYPGTDIRTETPETSLSCPVCGIVFLDAQDA